MKKQLITLIAMLLPMLASAETVEIDGIYYNLVSKIKEAEVTSNPNKYSGEVVIPEVIEYNGVAYNVTSISEESLERCFNLTSIIIPNSVTSIRYMAFANCSGLTSITIPNSVTSIGYNAFSGCTNLTTIHITDIGAWCKINFATNIANPLSFAQHLFLNDKEIHELVIPDNVTSIGNYAFVGCSGLTSVTIPNSVISIGTCAFDSCTGLISVTISNDLIVIGEGAFTNCGSLVSITIPNSVATIGNYAFRYCNSLTSITIPNSVRTIGDLSFYGCRSLTSIIIGSCVTNIGSNAFGSCPEIKDVYCYAENVPTTSSDAFEDSYIEYATLHVPASSVNDYKAAEPWKNFKSIVDLDDNTPEIQKCATPVIIYENGKLMFACATEGVEYVTDITCADIKKHYSSAIDLTGTYTVSVYATKTGYENSDVATKEIQLSSDTGSGIVGDLNNDGKTDAADVVKLVNIITGKE